MKIMLFVHLIIFKISALINGGYRIVLNLKLIDMKSILVIFIQVIFNLEEYNQDDLFLASLDIVLRHKISVGRP